MVKPKDSKFDYSKSKAAGALSEVKDASGPWDGGRPASKEENLVTQVSIKKPEEAKGHEHDGDKDHDMSG